jgi:hypothetical protein
MAGRYGSTLDVSTFMAVCRSHHDRIHSYPNEAREKGYLKGKTAFLQESPNDIRSTQLAVFEVVD